MKNKICLVGLGYMGLPTAFFFSKAGYDVSGFDINEVRIKELKDGILPFEEKGLAELFSETKDMRFSSNIEDFKDCNVFIISVPTPITSDKKCDLSYVISATKSVKKVIKEGDLVILESTVKPGTTENVVKPILDESEISYDLAFVSEKAIPGNTLNEMVNNARIIGGFDEKSALKVKELYSSFVKGEMHLTDCSTAEMAKLMENTYRDVNIALANEFDSISKNFGVNVWEAISLANLHPRVNIHQPGPGVGGHCIPIDPWFLIEDKKIENSVIYSSRIINDERPRQVYELLKSKLSSGSCVGILGASYKKNVDDPRESPTEELIKILSKEKVSYKLHDPHVKNFDFPLTHNLFDLNDCDIYVLMVDHDDYKDFKTNKEIIDTKNFFND